MVASRLFGQETEYAIRFSAPAGSESAERPDHSLIFHAFRAAVKKFVRIRPGEWSFFKESFFVENGGAFNYESQPYAPEAGLIEGATPECRSPLECLVYQRAQEQLLLRAIPEAEAYLRRKGFPGSLGLLKNCRDAEGHIYGAQENYGTDIASGLRLWLYRMGLVLCLPLLLFWWVLYMGCLTLVVTLSLLVQFCLWLGYSLLHGFLSFPAWMLRSAFLQKRVDDLTAFKDRLAARWSMFSESTEFHRLIARLEYTIFFPPTLIILWPYTLLLRLCAFVPQRRQLTAFFASRVIFTGAGTLLEAGADAGGGVFALSEKGTAVKRMNRITIGPEDRPLFDNGNLHKAFMLAGLSTLVLRPASFLGLFTRRSRFQIGMADSNRAQFAEYLKFGTSLLVLDAFEAGYLKDAPRLRRPVRSLRELVHDCSLSTSVPVHRLTTTDGERKRNANALELQRWYLERVRQYLHDRDADEGAASITPERVEEREIFRLWSECLDLLTDDPGKLIGRLDWVTKRYLIEAAGRDLAFSAQKKIDLGYHELGGAYFDRLEAEGIAPKLAPDDAVSTAVFQPSSPERVQLRSRLIRDSSYGGRRITVSWNRVRIGDWWDRKIISLDVYRNQKNKGDGHP